MHVENVLVETMRDPNKIDDRGNILMYTEVEMRPKSEARGHLHSRMLDTSGSPGVRATAKPRQWMEDGRPGNRRFPT